MTINVKEQSLKNKLDAANLNVLADELRALKIGSLLRAMPTSLRKKAPAVDASQLATLQSFGLADDGHALSILSAYARAGGVTGPLAIVAYGVTPATGQIAVAPNGDIVCLAADALTSVDINYQPEKYDVIELTLPVVPGTGVCALPQVATNPGAVLLLAAESISGAVVGTKIVLVPAGAAVATGKAALHTNKNSVWFAVADAVTSAKVKLAVSSSVDVDALLTAVAGAA